MLLCSSLCRYTRKLCTVDKGVDEDQRSRVVLSNAFVALFYISRYAQSLETERLLQPACVDHSCRARYFSFIIINADIWILASSFPLHL